MEKFEYINAAGESRIFETVDGAQRAYAADGFPQGGAIRKVEEGASNDAPADGAASAVPPADDLSDLPGWLLAHGYTVAIQDFADSDADRVVDIDGRDIAPTDEVYPGVASVYTDRAQAQSIWTWLASWVTPGDVSWVEVTPTAAPSAAVIPTATVSAPIAAAFGMTGIPGVTVQPVAPLRTVAEATFSEVARDRIDENDAILARLGIVRPPSDTTSAGYRKGTTVVGLGYKNLGVKRRAWENQPRVGEAADFIGRTLAAEEREDVTVDTRSLRMRDDGVLCAGSDTLLVEPRGFASLLAFLRTPEAEMVKGTDGIERPRWLSPDAERKARQLAAIDGDFPQEAHGLYPRGAAMLLAADPDLRAAVFNRQVAHAAARDLVLRVRKAQVEGSVPRALYAAVSTGYTPIDADVASRSLADSLDRMGLGEMRGEVLYSPETTALRMDATLHAPRDIVDLAAGDAFKMGLRFRSDDSGGGSVNGGGIAWWNECLNLIILHTQRGADLFRMVHKGDADAALREMQRGVEAQREAFEHFARQWGLLRTTDIAGFSFRGVTYTGIEDCIAHLVEQRELDKTLARDVLVQHVLTAHAAQGGGDTLQSIIDAVTRAAHTAMIDECQRERLERAAGDLVPVLAMAAEA